MIRYIPGRFGHRVGDWNYQRGQYAYAGYGFIRPSPNVPLEEDKKETPDSAGAELPEQISK